MKNHLLLLLLIPLLSITCKPDNDPESELGALYVTVKRNNEFVSDAIVVTDPETDFFQTDFSGSVIIKDINPGSFYISASHPIKGSGSETATVVAGEITSVEIMLSSTVIQNPNVYFTKPTMGSQFDIDTPIEFTISVSDNIDAPEDILLEWSSDIDGLLSTQSANSNGTSSIFVNDLSEGNHVIQIKATDTNGFVGVDLVNIMVSNILNSVVLDLPVGQSSGIQLEWSTSDEPSFSNYKVYRSDNNSSDYNVIEIINDLNTTSFFDENVSIGENYFYQIGVNFSNGDESLSNVQEKNFEGVTIAVGVQVEKMVVDPNRPFIYALNRLDNSLLFIDTDLGQVTKTITVGTSPTDLDFSLDGEKLYLTNNGSTQINVVDLNTQEIDFSFNVDPNVGTWGGNPYRLAVLSNNRLAYTSQDQWNSIKIVDATTGANLSFGESIYRPDLYANSDGDVLYAAESGSSGSQVLRYNLTGNTIESSDASASGSAQRGSFLTVNGEYIFFRKQKILAANLSSSLGSFSDNIYAANKDGSIALGEEQYFNGINFSILGFLPISTKIMAADPNEDIFYLYNSMNSTIVVFTP